MLLAARSFYEWIKALRSLPPIASDTSVRLLPLADTTLIGLSEAVLCEEDAQRLSLIEGVVWSDPSLALWSVCFAWANQQRALATAHEVAWWLDQFGLALIASNDSTEKAASNDNVWTPCLTESFARRVQAESVDDPTTSPFTAMLFNVGQWQVCLGDSLQGPPWLAEATVDNCATVDNRASVDRKTSKISPEVSRLTRIWQAEHPISSSLFQRAMTMRQRVSALERRWDDSFLHEKLASLKEFTYGASHELNNPLFNISSRAQVLLRDEEDPQRRRKLSTIYAHAMRASEMINDIALAARPPNPRFAPVDLAALSQNLVQELRGAADAQSTSLSLTCDKQQVIDGDAEQLAVALREIMINAIESLRRCTHRGEVNISIRPVENGAEIIIADNGQGLDARAKRHLFDPFFSGYESGRGLGFGLTKCWQIIQLHHGSIVVDSQPGHGATFTLTLPKKQSVQTLNDCDLEHPGSSS